MNNDTNQPMARLFDDLNHMLSEPACSLYRAALARDECEVVRLLDAHRDEHGEPEQIAYAERTTARADDEELGRFPFATG